ncbi:hypothetical protein ACIRRA_42850 [Nocardia sp. NPDC101769]|uniref:hypothetical protein n=1 Tax=Nocardia sp. NPDC101769 TaxID=3364333 RepID=UPI0037F330D7
MTIRQGGDYGSRIRCQFPKSCSVLTCGSEELGCMAAIARVVRLLSVDVRVEQSAARAASNYRAVL